MSGYSKFVGRVGALAVALGVGVALTNSATAWADETDSDPGTSRETSTAESSSGSSQSSSSAAPSSDETLGSETDPSGVDDTDADPAFEDDIAESVTDADDDPAVDASATPGDSATVAIGDDDADDDADNAPRDRDRDRAGDSSVAILADDVSLSGRSASAQPVASLSPSTSADEDLGLPVESSASTRTSADAMDIAAIVPFAATAAGAAAPEVSAAGLSPTGERNLVRTAVSSFRSAFGVDQQSSTPAAPVHTSALWALLGWIRRDIEYTFFNRSPTMYPLQTGQTEAGVVTGSLNGEDFNGRTLTYGGSGATAKGNVVVDPVTGAYTYTADAEFAATGGTDTFWATANNTDAYRLPGFIGVVQEILHRGAQFLGFAQSDTTRQPVLVTLVVDGPKLLGVVETDGQSTEQVLSEDGTRFYQTTELHDEDTDTYTTQVLVIDSETGTQLGSPITLAGRNVGGLVFTDDGTRAMQTTTDDWFAPKVVYVAVIDTDDGSVVGSPITLDGAAGGVLQVTPDGTRAFQTTKVFDEDTETYTTVLATIDPVTGTLIGEPITVDGSPYGRTTQRNLYAPLQFNTDGTRAVLTTTSVDSGTSATNALTRVAVIDTVTGALVDAPTTIGGSPVGPTQFSPDGTRALRVVRVHGGIDDPGETTRVVVIDPVTGTLVADPVSLIGAAASHGQASTPDVAALAFSPDGSQAFLTTGTLDFDTGEETTRIAAIQVADGSLIGTPTVLDGRPYRSLGESAQDPTRLYQTILRPSSMVDPSDPSIIIDTSTTTIAVIDSADGTLIGASTITGLPYRPAGGDLPLAVSADGTRAVQTTVQKVVQNIDVLADVRTRVAVIDTTTGTLVRAPYEIDGTPPNSPVLSADGSRVFQIVDTESDNPRSRLVILDITDGADIGYINRGGTTVGSVQLSPDGTRALWTTSASVITIHPVTGDMIRSTNYDGTVVGPLQFSADGQHAYLTTNLPESDDQPASTRTLVIEVADGRAIGTWAELGGEAADLPEFSPDGALAYLTTEVDDESGEYTTTKVAVISTATGALTSIPITIDGIPDALWISDDGTRVIQTVSGEDPGTGTPSTGVAVIDTGTAPIPPDPS